MSLSSFPCPIPNPFEMQPYIIEITIKKNLIEYIYILGYVTREWERELNHLYSQKNNKKEHLVA